MATSVKQTVSEDLKERVKEHWERQPCGTRELPANNRKAFFDQLERERYMVEPYLRDFARFERGRGKKLLEIGVGAGTDFINWVRNGAQATGIDLTEQGISLAKERVALEGLTAELKVADAENLPFADNTFDLVYSYGVLHHSLNTAKAIQEVHRVLKPAGTAIIMVYHVPSWTGFMLWGIHCLVKLRPWKSPRWAIYQYLESPGTKAYTVKEAQDLFANYSDAHVRPQLGNGDLLLMRPDQRYQKWYYKLAWALYPRAIIKLTGNRFGLFLLIEATK